MRPKTNKPVPVGRVVIAEWHRERRTHHHRDHGSDDTDGANDARGESGAAVAVLGIYLAAQYHVSQL